MEYLKLNSTLLATFFSAMFTSLILVPPVSKIAIRFGGMDRVDERKIHRKSTPRLGGIAIFFGFLLAFLLFSDVSTQSRGVIVGGILIFLTGLADDLAGIPPWYKLCGELLAATVGVVMSGLVLSTLGNPFGFGEIHLGALAVPFTVFAVVGVINAINLIDGLDGLAGGVSSIACVAFAVLAHKTGNDSLVLLSVALLGGTLGFLRYNTFPAKIFMGDSGSLFVGYCLGLYSVKLVIEGHGGISPSIPLIILGVPILDTLVVMVNRFRRGEKIFLPDKTHIHHRLLDLGIGHKFCVFLVYGMTYLLCLCAVAFYNFEELHLVVGFLLASTVFYTIVNRLSHVDSVKVTGVTSRGSSTRSHQTRRKIIATTRILVLVIKYLLIVILMLSVMTPSVHMKGMAIVASCLLLLSMLLLFYVRGWGNLLFQVVLYVNAAFILFMMENYGAGVYLMGLPILTISDYLFFFLLLIEGVKIFLRKSTGKLINSPFEYLILFMVICVPLLPQEMVDRYHLYTVAGKSVILFTAYKLILMRQVRQNRKIVFATGTALFAFSLRFLGWI